MQEVGLWVAGKTQVLICYDKNNFEHHWWFKKINSETHQVEGISPISYEDRRCLFSLPWERTKIVRREDGSGISLINIITDFTYFSLDAKDIEELIIWIFKLLNVEEDENELFDDIALLDKAWLDNKVKRKEECKP